jgi:hypothetical protein
MIDAINAVILNTVSLSGFVGIAECSTLEYHYCCHCYGYSHAFKLGLIHSANNID